MDCPACGRALRELTVGELTVDVCDGGCGGIWFDRLELRQVDESHEPAGQHLLAIGRDPGVRVDPAQRRNCPKCPETVMMRHFFGVRHEVEVDECPRCAGFWLDHGELAKVRSQFNSPQEREQAERDWFQKTHAEGLARMKLEHQQENERLGVLARLLMFRFW